MGETRAHLFIQGKVQGVSFRYFTVQEAKSRNLTGWVRNLWDGRVEVIINGNEEAVKSMVEWCEHGPPSASVENVDISWEEPAAEFTNFRVRINASGVPS
jgi:acylphosphatase